MEQVRIFSSDELYAAGLLSGKTYVCRFMRCCRFTGRRTPCMVVPPDIRGLPMDTVLEDVHMKLCIPLGLLVQMTHQGVITPVFTSKAFEGRAPHAFATPVVCL